LARSRHSEASRARHFLANARKAIARSVLATTVRDPIGATATAAIGPIGGRPEQARGRRVRSASAGRIVPEAEPDVRRGSEIGRARRVMASRPEQARARRVRSVSAGRIAPEALAADVRRGSGIGRARRVMAIGRGALTDRRAIDQKGRPAIGIVLGRRAIETAIARGRRVKLGREIGPGHLATGIGRGRRAIVSGSALVRRVGRGRQAAAGSGRKAALGIGRVAAAPGVRLQDHGRKAARFAVRPRRGRRVRASVRLANGVTTSRFFDE
jgi:hypothetical protein